MMHEEIQELIEQLSSALYNGFHSGDRKSFELVHRAYESLSSLLEENKRMKEALVPFVAFAENVDSEGWTSNIHRERISTWFGPSDFWSARSALKEVGND